MALTAKPIATISYNTEQFIERKLEQLFNAKIIVDYRWIKHYGEDGDKDHIHLIMYPNKRIDTGLLQDEFKEVVATETKPLGVLPIRTSKPDHWLMYALHDADYLEAHKSDNDGDGKIRYELEDIHTPYAEQLARDYKKALSLRRTQNQEIIDSFVKDHQTLTQALYSLNANPMQIIAIRQALSKEQEIEAYNDARVEALTGYIQKMQKAIEIKGQITQIEELPQLKVEKQMGVVSVHHKQLKMNYATGEIEEEDKGIKQVREEEVEDMQ